MPYFMDNSICRDHTYSYYPLRTAPSSPAPSLDSAPGSVEPGRDLLSPLSVFSLFSAPGSWLSVMSGNGDLVGEGSLLRSSSPI